MKREDLEKLSDRELEQLVAVASGYNADYVEGNPDIAPKYLSDFNDMMPLVFEAGISLVFMDPGYEAHSLKNGDEANNTSHDNGLRAAAIVYLLMQGQSNA